VTLKRQFNFTKQRRNEAGGRWTVCSDSRHSPVGEKLSHCCLPQAFLSLLSRFLLNQLLFLGDRVRCASKPVEWTASLPVRELPAQPFSTASRVLGYAPALSPATGNAKSVLPASRWQKKASLPTGYRQHVDQLHSFT
jgi:hypothetical protein